MSVDPTPAVQFRRMLKWIAVVAVVMVGASLAFLHRSGGLTIASALATVAGVFLSVMLGSGLLSLAYFSAKSGHDQDVSDWKREDHEPGPPSPGALDRGGDSD